MHIICEHLFTSCSYVYMNVVGVCMYKYLAKYQVGVQVP